jgi:hypothetical protein
MDYQQYWQFGAALVFVLALIGVLFFVIQRIGGGGGRGRRGSRLGVVEAAVVDKRRRLVLVRRDSVEHLIMIGGPQDVVVESRITKREPSFDTDSESGPVRPSLHERPAASAPSFTPAADEPRLSTQRDPRLTLDTAPQASAVEPDADALPREDHPPQYRPHVPAPTRAVTPQVEEARAPYGAAAAMPAPSEQDPPRMEPSRPPARVQAEPQLEPEPDERPHALERAAAAPAAPSRSAPPPSDQHPWPPSEGRFREAQRRFAERSEHTPQTPRSGRDHDEHAYGPHHPADRPVSARAVAGQPSQSGHDRRHEEAHAREPANLNVRPGEDR